MPEIKPFAAIRFNSETTGGDVSNLIAPPYDVLDEEDKSALISKSDCNIVGVDLPHIPPKSAGPVEVYQSAAARLEKWLADGTLVRETKPAIYVYHQRFEHGGQSYTRRMFIARVRLQPFSEGSILPHEKTFGGPKEDRLALMKATKCQLSPIFGLYSDTEDRIGKTFAGATAQAANVTGTLNDVENQMWIVTDAGVIDGAVSALADKKIYIADGHHRYGTALLYRDWLTEQNGGSLPEDHPANYIMFVLASMEDPGCLILPYNRALPDTDFIDLRDAWWDGIEVVARDSASAQAADDQDGPAGEADLVVYEGETGTATPLRFTNREVLKSLEPGQVSAWYDLDYAYLHRYLIDELLVEKMGADNVKVGYVKSVEDAKEMAREKSGVALLTKATPMSHLRAVSETGGLMPQKSTYFHPKLATGMTINPLE